MREGGYLPLAGYGLVGDCLSSALVGVDGSVDWACLPRFDSPALFARILDGERGGSWRLAPAGPYESTFRYVDRTAILETEHRTSTGALRVRDGFVRMADDEAPGLYVRACEALAGEVEVESTLEPTLSYGREPARVEPDEAGLTIVGSDLLLRVAGTVDGLAPETRFSLRQGERATFVLGWGDELPRPADAEALVDETARWWRAWADDVRYSAPYEDAVARSLVTLKLLTYAKTGALVAAPTASLPEVPGGDANWDYRFTWLRDASIALNALLATGEEREGEAFFDWICARIGAADVARDGVRVMYDVDGGSDHEEQELTHLEGYRGSRPVRVGNAACTQTQLDVYGEVLECFATSVGWGRTAKLDLWDEYRPLPEWVCVHWEQPDNGIWELRGPERHYVHSKLMAWVALDRAVRMAETFGLPGNVARWRMNAGLLRESILEHGWNERLGCFKQAYDRDRPDAANLLVPLVGFLPAEDPRVVANLERTLSDLASDGLVFRFRGDEPHAGEGTFTLCGFWLVNALAVAGRVDEAREVFEGILGRATPLGLLGEEIDPTSGDHLGNFPQAFVHAGLVTAAANLARATGVGEVSAAARASPGMAHLVEER